MISIHAPFTGSDRLPIFDIRIKSNFNPLPLRGATVEKQYAMIKELISIHAPLTGSDYLLQGWSVYCTISIHAPLTGSDPQFPGRYIDVSRFQSTLPLRGSDSSIVICFTSLKNSIHAPLTGSDWFTLSILAFSQFQSTLPYGERPGCHCCHAQWYQFQSTLPYGERRAFSKRPNSSCRFQSTLPLRGATTVFWRQYQREHISIHAPLTGSDKQTGKIPINIGNFNPRSLYRERLQTLRSSFKISAFSIHAPLTGSDTGS